ncbi:MAG: hypothetical protein P1Q69_20525 [Candidatus Thorarchaeota archaeon]|nr:hypothetical protein [Candidatus Thorarchaeota archaeon]
MLVSRKKQTLDTMSVRELFSLWWQEKWVRYLVISLSPIGFLDAVYTLMLFNAHGADFEYNLFVRAALTSAWMPVWFLADVLSFSLFAMIAGSYYLHTRSKIYGNKTGWLSFLVAIRVGAAAYNILLYYNTFLFNAIFIPALGGVLIGVLVFILVGGLLSRNDDVTWDGFKSYVRSKYDRFHDKRLTRGLKTYNEGSEETSTTVTEQDSDEFKVSRRVWIKRAVYMALAISMFFPIPFLLQFVADVTGLSQWTEIYGPFWFFNELSSRGFMVGFVAVLLMIGTIMYLIAKSFDAEEGSW